MNEQRWLSETDPTPMVEFLKSRGSLRQFRLFVSACCRRIMPLGAAEISQRWLALLEDTADDAAVEKQLAAVSRQLIASHFGHTNERVGLWLQQVIEGTSRRGFDLIAWAAARAAAWGMFSQLRRLSGGLHAVSFLDDPGAVAASERERLAQCHDLRDIFGNPFRPRPALDASWLRWNDGTIPRLARSIYDERAFDRLPILADALEEAGCSSTDILGHCRSGEAHARGCWVLDLVL
jgi:hypothetical protein